MTRFFFALVALTACWAAPARADTLPLIVGVPETYVPGEQFTFEVRVPQLADFSSYTLELVFATDVDNPPLVATATRAATNYPFPQPSNFQSDGVIDGERFQLTLSDSTSPGVQAIPGVNDVLAFVTVNPGADLTGTITLSIGSNTQFEFNMEGNNPDSPQEIPIMQAGGSGGSGGSGGPDPVPTPPAIALLGIGGVLLGARAKFARKPAA